MPQLSATPGVYVNEVASQSKPIEGVSTSVAAFVGLAPWGPVNTPTRITSWLSFARVFGGELPDGPFMEGAYLAHSVYGFFQNGGSACWVVRVGPGAYSGVAQTALEDAAKDVVALRVIAREGAVEHGQSISIELEQEQPADTAPATSSGSPGKAGAKEAGAKQEAQEGSGSEGSDSSGDGWAASPTFKLVVSVGSPAATGDGEAEPPASGTGEGSAASAPEPEIYEKLTLAQGANHIVTLVNEKSRLVQVVGGEGTGPQATPAPGKFTLAVPDPSSEKQAIPAEISGDKARGTGLAGLAVAEEVTMVCVPDLMSLAKSEDDIRGVQSALVSFCEPGRRMAILDPPQGLSSQGIETWSRQTTASPYATLYWPWIRVAHPLDGHIVEVPPCGHVAGVWARTDSTRGVFKAPANETVREAIGLAVEIKDADQDPLNRAGVNCIRAFPGRGILTWGARTLATESDPEWKYLNVRRLFNYLTASIARGTSWAVFEPNDETLWSQLRISVSDFLTVVWREGGLFGASPAEAFFVKCDGETNPQELIDLGQVNIHVGVAPVKPAEFVVFQISQQKPVT